MRVRSESGRKWRRWIRRRPRTSSSPAPSWPKIRWADYVFIISWPFNMFYNWKYTSCWGIHNWAIMGLLLHMTIWLLVEWFKARNRFKRITSVAEDSIKKVSSKLSTFTIINFSHFIYQYFVTRKHFINKNVLPPPSFSKLYYQNTCWL